MEFLKNLVSGGCGSSGGLRGVFEEFGGSSGNSSGGSSFGNSSQRPDVRLPREVEEEIQKKAEEIADNISPTAGKVVRKINEFNNTLRDIDDIAKGKIPDKYQEEQRKQAEKNYKEAKIIAQNANRRYKSVKDEYDKLLKLANESINKLVNTSKNIEMTQLRKFIDEYKKINKEQMYKDKRFVEVSFNKETFLYTMSTETLSINTMPNQIVQFAFGGIGSFVLEANSEEAIAEAQQFSNRIDDIIREIYTKQVVLRDIYNTSKEMNEVLNELSMRFNKVLSNLISAFQDKGVNINYDKLSLEEKSLLELSMNFVININKLLKTKVINGAGNIDPDCKVLIKDAEKFLKVTICKG